MSENEDNAGILTHPPIFYIGAMLIGFGLDYIFPLAIGYKNITGPASIVVFCVGLVIAVMGFKKFSQHKQSPSVHASAVQVFTSGIYSVTRNPLYLSLLMLVITIGLYLDKAWLLFVCLPLVILLTKLVIEKEEAYLERKFGEEYLDYKKKVRRWI
jgi:protein-S-isoprenylcysteine O-methyltransferase Ste14|tara:strand:- start:91278 stop:91745 length:468 start_codon:yes stop_codon:yes gene_type:complete